MDMKFFPAELKALQQWCVATLLPLDDGKEDKAPLDPKTGRHASTTDPATWGSFDQAMAFCEQLRSSARAPRAMLGFVFNEDDPYAVIDLDTYKAKAEGVKELHAEICRNAQTYTELSQSGLGTHIIGRGLVIDGARNEPNCIELYSHARFMICTGNVGVGNAITPIEDIQPLLDYLYALIRKGSSYTRSVSWRELGDGEESLLSDLDIVERAMNAANADVFLRLCQGDTSMHGGDHSRADEALIQFFCFYTPDNTQVARLFLRSELGQRDKATDRPDYIPRSIAFARARLENDKPPPLDHAAIAQRAALVASAARHVPDAPYMLDENRPVSKLDDVPDEPPLMLDFAYPPGLIGDIARYAFAAAIRPVPEIALAGAIATMAGIVGRQYNISATGLNLYILLLAKTGTGKESIQSSLDRLFAAVSKTVPAAETFLGPSRFASGQALNKRFQKQPCFVSILGEFGDTMKRISSPRANGADLSLQQELKDMFHKSGADQMLRATVHSDAEKNTANVQSPTLTILGETAPEPFFASLDESLVESGFLPRFMVIEYKGERPRRNVNPNSVPPASLVQAVADLCAACLQMQQNRQVFVVNCDAEGQRVLDQFDRRADREMRGKDEVTQQMWNRAHIKALRLAALVAVGVNYSAPMITHDVARWAVDMIEKDVAVILNRFNAGDVGEGDAKMRADMVGIVKRYFLIKPQEYEKFHAKGCIPIRYLKTCAANRPAFKKHRNGAMKATEDLLMSMARDGDLMQVDAKTAKTWFNTASAVYALGDNWDSA